MLTNSWSPSPGNPAFPCTDPHLHLQMGRSRASRSSSMTQAWHVLWPQGRRLKIWPADSGMTSVLLRGHCGGTKAGICCIAISAMINACNGR
jgi:hypothetical protein